MYVNSADPDQMWHPEASGLVCTVCLYHIKRDLGLYGHDMGLDARKPVFGDLRTTQAQTSLRIRAV